jgi:anti-sigma factor RsiW
MQGETTVRHVSAEDIAALVDRTISPQRCRQVVTHLADCVECRKAVGEIAISQSVVNDPAPPTSSS